MGNIKINKMQTWGSKVIAKNKMQSTVEREAKALAIVNQKIVEWLWKGKLKSRQGFLMILQFI